MNDILFHFAMEPNPQTVLASYQAKFPELAAQLAELVSELQKPEPPPRQTLRPLNQRTRAKAF